jgi:hypothetical protein
MRVPPRSIGFVSEDSGGRVAQETQVRSCFVAILYAAVVIRFGLVVVLTAATPGHQSHDEPVPIEGSSELAGTGHPLVRASDPSPAGVAKPARSVSEAAFSSNDASMRPR